MRKALLLYNPDSGGNQTHRRRELDAALAILRNGGVEVELAFTESRDHAGDHARRAIQDGCDTVFACGGDGTIHNVIQVLAQSPVALAVLPMGTANALAHDLKLPLKVAAAAAASLRARPHRISLGHARYLNFSGQMDSRYFVIAAGVGVDAHLFYGLQHGTKRRLGMTAYYLKAWHLWFTYPMPRFRAEYLAPGSHEPQQASLTELMSIRIRNFGGVLRELAPGASLESHDLRLVLCHTASRFAYLAYVTRALLGLRCAIPGVELTSAKKVSCHYSLSDVSKTIGYDAPQQKIYVEADGELLGTLPLELTVVADALTVLTPEPISAVGQLSN